ncbi:zinc finger HIT domain-containing protein 2 [Python bivittatus]|uniref:Zinc finger HIT domain-containing protein 2 n=1 Tax=Python bivittatus TaxID=176946 RepID=A0A9F2WI84_PYTBI|nr:zinc finger HIT domain-containing protein 2 [Python bivittatus]
MEAASSSPAGSPCCGLCQAERAPYTCPRCHLRFCSVPCYREHGFCARDFQNRELQLRLQGQRGDVSARRRLKEALLRLEELRDPGDADPDLGLDPHGEDLWDQLTPQQRQTFQQLLSSGKISAIWRPWQPWWAVGNRGASLIQEIGAEDAPDSENSLQQQPPPGATQGLEASPRLPKEGTVAGDPSLPLARGSNSVPALPGVIPPLSTLTSAPVSPLVRFQLPNVLFGYAYALSLYNGEADDAELLPEFCGTVLDLSAALGAQRVFSSTGEALQAALQAVTGSLYPECPLGNAGVMVAVAQILMGPCQAEQSRFSLAALAHLSRLLGRAKRQVPSEDQPRMYKAKKKCEFLLSWVKEHGEELTLLALEVQREYKAHREAAKEVGGITQELEKMWGGKLPPSKKPLMEELD